MAAERASGGDPPATGEITGAGACDIKLDVVTREQMASFLRRAFGVAASATDAFTDDETSIHEADINAVAAAGIATGCGGSRYCPLGTVTRGQMAGFLERILF